MPHFPGLKREIDDGGEEVQGLAPEKIHGAERLQKHDGRRRHPARHDGVGDTIQERSVLGGQWWWVGMGGEGVVQAGPKPIQLLPDRFSRGRVHQDL